MDVVSTSMILVVLVSVIAAVVVWCEMRILFEIYHICHKLWLM